jgi:hypothetical protein
MATEVQLPRANWWAYRRRIEWIEIVFQVGLAAIAIAFFAGVGCRWRV